MAHEPETLAVLGVGAMGSGMARSALRAGIRTIVWDRNPARARDLADAGADFERTADTAASRAGIVITMVTDADAVMSVATEQGMLDAIAPDAIWIQMSTIGVAGTERVMSLVADRRPDVHLLDAPVSGSKEPAERGELTVFASGPEEVRGRVVPVFDALGQRTEWVGPLGAGTRMKLVNNTLLAFTNEGVVASIALAHRLGLDTQTVLDALRGGPLASPWASAKFERIARDDYSPQFALALALKDVHLALEAVDARQFEALAGLAHEWERVVDDGLGDEDLTVVASALEARGARR
jgi:3-hydroxyisobutyrate dehydrogenase